MTILKNWLLQAGAVLAQSGIVLTDLVPPESRTGAVLVIAAVQGVAAVVAHYRNPDGTAARASWQPRR